MATCLVTGGAGFIGSTSPTNCWRAGHEVVVLDDLSGGFVENVSRGAAFVEGSITDAALVDAALRRSTGSTTSIHLAAYAAEGLSHFIRRFNYTNNLIGSVNLINAAVNTDVQLLRVHLVDRGVRSRAELPMTEETRRDPEDPYGIAKLAVEQDLAACQDMFGLDYVIFRPHNVYGERQNIGDRTATSSASS